MTGLLARVAVQVWIFCFIVFFGAEVIHLEPQLRIFTHVLFGVPLLVWAVWRMRRPWAWDCLDVGVLGLLAVYVGVAAVSRDRTESLNTVGMAAAYATLFLLLRRVGIRQFVTDTVTNGQGVRPSAADSAGGWRTTLVVAAAIGLAATLAYNAWLQVDEKLRLIAAVGGAPWEGLNVFPWESVNAMPILVVLAVVFVAWMPAGVPRRVLAVVVVAAATVVVPFSVGRAGWMALAVMAVAWLATTDAAQQLIARASVPARLTGAAIVVVGVVAVVAVAAPKLYESLDRSGRILLYEQGASMAASAPWLGSGPGTYPWVRLEHFADGANLIAVRLVHNVAFQTLLDGGLVLLVAFIGVVAAWVATVWRRRARLSPADRLAAAALLGLASASWLDDFSYLPAIIVLIVAVAAFLAPAPSEPGRVRPAWGRAAVGVLVLAWLVALPNVIGVDLARSNAQSARDAAVDLDWAGAEARFSEAIRWHPENGGYRLGLGMATSHLGELDAAADAYRAAREAASGDPRAYAALAELTGNPVEAVDLLRQAADRTLGDPQYAARLGAALQAAGDPAGAIGAWAEAVALDTPILAQLPDDIDRGAVSDAALAWIERSHLGDDLARWDIGLAIGSLPDDAGAAWQAVLVAQSGDFEAAEALARSVIDDSPWAAIGHQALVAVAAFQCDLELEASALADEALTRGAFAPLAPEPHVRREFVFREASLGPTQPAGVPDHLDPGIWPWWLVPRPACPAP